MNQVINTFGFIFNHPLAGKHKVRALNNWLRWQVNSRTHSRPIEVPFVGSTRLSVARGMYGATGNIYCGLHEFEDMAFVLHFLRPSERFIDIGANIGSYTILASGVCGAKTVAVEPVSKTAAALRTNIKLNGLDSLVRLEEVALGDKICEVRVSNSLDCTNHVIGVEDSNSYESVAMATLDQLAANLHPIFLKIDVEGFESKVLDGGENVLSDPKLLGVLMELNGSGQQYGVTDSELYQKMISFGFQSYQYHPFERSIVTKLEKDHREGNVLFLRNADAVSKRLEEAAPFHLFGEAI